MAFPSIEEPLDGVLEAADAAKDAVPDGLVVHNREPGPLDLIHAPRADGREVQLEARMVGQSGVDLGVHMGAVVAEHLVHLATGIPLGHQLQKPEELLVAVACIGAAGDLAGGDVKRGEQRCGAMPDLAVGARSKVVPDSEASGSASCVDHAATRPPARRVCASVTSRKSRVSRLPQLVRL